MTRATYNITNDKLKVWFDERLSPEAYAASKAARFNYWHGSKCFVAKWSTSAEDFILSKGIDIEEDDQPDDVAARVARFDKYSAEAERSAEASQTYLNERANTARRKQNAANSIERNLSAAEHWQQRIEGAIRHAAYKEQPGVIARRIKGLTTDLTRAQKILSLSINQRAMWDDEQLDMEGATALANCEPGYGISRCFLKSEFPLSTYEGQQSLWGMLDKKQITAEQARELALNHHAGVIADRQRWITHIENRITYEKALLVAAGVSLDVLTPARRKPAPVTTDTVQGARPEVMGAFGGRGYVFKIEEVGADDWFLITKVNKKTVEYLNSQMYTGSDNKPFKRYSINKTEIHGLRFLRTPAEVAEKNPKLLADWENVQAIRERNAARKAEALKAAA